MTLPTLPALWGRFTNGSTVKIAPYSQKNATTYSYVDADLPSGLLRLFTKQTLLGNLLFFVGYLFGDEGGGFGLVVEERGARWLSLPILTASGVAPSKAAPIPLR